MWLTRPGANKFLLLGSVAGTCAIRLTPGRQTSLLFILVSWHPKSLPPKLPDNDSDARSGLHPNANTAPPLNSQNMCRQKESNLVGDQSEGGNSGALLLFLRALPGWRVAHDGVPAPVH